MFGISAVYKCICTQAGLIPARQPLHNPKKYPTHQKQLDYPFCCTCLYIQIHFFAGEIFPSVKFLSKTFQNPTVDHHPPVFPMKKSNSINLPQNHLHLMLDHSIPTWSPVKLPQNKVHHDISWILSHIFQMNMAVGLPSMCVFPGVFHSFPPFPPSCDQPIGQHQASSPSAPRHWPPADTPRRHLRGLQLVFLGKNHWKLRL